MHHKETVVPREDELSNLLLSVALIHVYSIQCVVLCHESMKINDTQKRKQEAFMNLHVHMHVH